MILLDILHSNSLIIYFILSLLIIISSIFPFNYFFYCEFFIFIGAILSGINVLNFLNTFLLVLISGFIGNSINYLIGYKYKNKLFEYFIKIELIKKIINYSGYNDEIKSFQKKSYYKIFTGGFLFFFRYLTSFLAGKSKITYFKFLKYSSLGLLTTMGFILFLGFFVGKNLQNIYLIIKNFIYLIIYILIIIFLSYFYIKKFYVKKYNKLERLIKNKRINIIKIFLKHIVLIFYTLIIIYIVMLYIIFFYFGYNKNNDLLNGFNYNINKIEDITNYTNFYTYFDSNKNKIIQPINVIIITNNDIKTIFNELGWIENKTFLGKNINLNEFYSLYKLKELPVSNLYLNGKIQDMAFQIKSNSNFKRTHLRVWNFGKLDNNNVYLVSISKDTRIDLELYNKFLTPIHEIDLNVDNQRNFLIDQFSKKYVNITTQKIKLKNVTSNKYYFKYNSDGFIYVIKM